MSCLPRYCTRPTLTLFVTAFCFAATVVHAQDAAPAHIAVVDGNATLDTERGSEPAVIGLPLIPGDRLRTTGGRIEVLFPDGSVLDIDEYTTVDLRSDTLLRLAGGRLLLTVAGANDPANALPYQVDTPVASARNEGPGEYRMALLNGVFGLESELAVIRGAASLTTEHGSTLVRAGERSMARDNSAPSYPQRFNSARFDAFDRWTDARRDARLGPTASAQYLPRDLQTYGGVFDRSGSWLFEPSYGYVWYPTVGPTWRPYYNGYWTTVRPYGWTWIGLDLWGYPTHHYGRWGVARNRWFWIPDRRWGPAWVSWAAAPGYVSWCPLGFDNRPVISLNIRTGSPWAGWVLVPRQHFGTPGRHVQQFAVTSPALSVRTPLVVQATAPVPPARAVPRPSNGNAVGAGVAVPRSTLAAPAAGSSSTSNAVAAGARAVPRQGTRSPEAPATTTSSPVFKLPLSETRQRSADPSPSSSAAQAPVYVPGARPSPGRERRDPVTSEPSRVLAPQARERAAMPRPGVASPQTAERPTAARPSVAMPPAPRSPEAVPYQAPRQAAPVAGPRTQAAPSAAPRTQPSPAARPPSAGPAPSTSGRAVPRSTQAQPSSGSAPASVPPPASAPAGAAPAGARSRSR